MSGTRFHLSDRDRVRMMKKFDAMYHIISIELDILTLSAPIQTAFEQHKVELGKFNRIYSNSIMDLLEEKEQYISDPYVSCILADVTMSSATFEIAASYKERCSLGRQLRVDYTAVFTKS